MKVTETVTEYAARLIVLVLEQMEQFMNGDWPESGPCSSESRTFYLRSFDPSNPLQAYFSIKSALETESGLGEHSSQVASALGEYALMSESFFSGIKSWEERLEEKIKFRAGDTTKSGRTISQATLSKLKEAHVKMGAALESFNASHLHIGELMELAEPKKSVNLVPELLIAIAKHNNEMAGVPSSS